jgi:hypothetical protein
VIDVILRTSVTNNTYLFSTWETTTTKDLSPNGPLLPAYGVQKNVQDDVNDDENTVVL